MDLPCPLDYSGRMRHDIDNQATYRRAISLLVTLTFLSLVLFPYHLHLEHDDSGAHVEHQVDIHSLADLGHDYEHQHDGHTFAPSADFGGKSSKANLPPIVLILVLLLLIPLLTGIHRPLVLPAPANRPRHFRLRTPPLRAPPASHNSY